MSELNISKGTSVAEVAEMIRPYLGSGKVLTSPSGCNIHTSPDEGMYFGVTPYGLDWMCSADESAAEQMAEWVLHWEVPRTETGALIQ